MLLLAGESVCARPAGLENQNILQNCSIFQYSKNVLHPNKALFILGNTPKTSVYMVEYFSGIISSVACHCHNCKGYWFDQVSCMFL